MAKASNFTFGTLPAYAKAYHKIGHVAKSARGLGLGKLAKILEFPFNIPVTAALSS